MSDTITSFPRVPLIGLEKPVPTIHYSAAQACITCDCGSVAPIMIRGLDRAGLCVVCQTKWVIASLQFANLDGRMTLDMKVGKWTGPMAASRDLDLPAIEAGH